jgi:hypothetical protein
MDVYIWEYRLIWNGSERKYYNKIFGNISGREFLDQQIGSQDQKKISVLLSYVIMNKVEGMCLYVHKHDTHMSAYIYFIDWKMTKLDINSTD